MSLWYCPKCDRPTQNFRYCSCGEPAVFQRFIMWAVEHEGELPACYQPPNKACTGRKASIRREQSKSYKALRQ